MVWLLASGAALAVPGRFVEEDALTLWGVADEGGRLFGWGVADVVDLDGDGVADVVTGAPQAGAGAGATIVLSGRDGAERFRHPGASGSGEGYSVADAGDIDGDGVHDLVSGAPGGDLALLLSGATGEVLRTLTGTAGEQFGAAVGRAGDVDRDGVDDVVVGAESADAGGEDAGRVAVFSGRTGALLWSADGARAGGQLGSGAGYLGDVTGDGVPDVAAGARGLGGRVVVLSGADGQVVREHVDPEGGGVLGQFFVSGVGDLDGDGVPDLYGGDYANPALGAGTGRAFVWSGADGSTLHVFTGDQAGAGLGPGRYAGDVDRDGVGDLVVGSWQHPAGETGAGRITVFSGADGSVLRTVTSRRAGENFGFDAVGLGDVDGDGAIDLLVSAASDDRVYLVGSVAPEPPDDTGAADDLDGAPAGPTGCGCRTGRTGPAGWPVWAALGLCGRRRRLP